jgi:RpiR family transcriptional regulator, carbohydrate utilization regulator
MENYLQDDDFLVRLQTSYASLRKSERKIADYLQKNANQRLDVSITEFAKLLEVSEATVSRFCRAVGFQGFQDLKLTLASSISSFESFKNIPVDIDETDSLAEVGKKLSDTLAGAIIETQRHLDMDRINAVVDAIVETRKVILYGIGGAAAVLKAANHLFVKAGIECVRYEDGYMQTVSASMIEEDCVAVGVSNTGLSLTVVNALKLASENGAMTVCITSRPDSPIAQVADICLLTLPHRTDVPLYGDFIGARISQLYIIDFLYLGIIFKLGDIAKQNLKKNTNALKEYYHPIFIPPTNKRRARR